MEGYKEIKKLSQNNEVYLARDEERGTLCVLRKLSVADENTLDIYRLLKRNNVCGVPEIYDIVCNEDENIVVEEYIEGVSLLSYISKVGVIPDVEIVEIATSICDILTKIHGIDPPVIHRDIKSGNVMLSNNGEVFLIDFNAGRLKGDDDINRETDTELMGTPIYAAPEQFGFGTSSPATDYYGLGMLINTMATGEVTRKVIKNSPFTVIISKCTRLEPKMRYISADMIKGELLNCINTYKYLNYEYEYDNKDEDVQVIYEYRTDGEKSRGFNDNYIVKQKTGRKSQGFLKKITEGVIKKGRISEYVTKGIVSEYFCPGCGAILNEQIGFSPNNESWVCTNCQKILSSENPKGSMKYPGVHWFCDNCNTNLNIQEGFTDTKGIWKCERCGFVNTIDDDRIW